MFKIFCNKINEPKWWLNSFKKSYIFIILFLIYVPLILVIFLSFTQPSIRGNVVLTFENNWNSGANYSKLFYDSTYNGNFTNSLINSIIIGLIVTPISLIIGLLATIGIWKAKNFTRSSVLTTAKITIVNPDVITGISLATLFVIAFLPLGLNLGWFTIILSQITFTVPYVIITIYPKIMKLNKNLVLASFDLNHGKISTLFRVIIPFLLPAILAATLIAFATSFDDFIITNLVRGRVATISTELYTMRRGIKSWAITFGALIILITIGLVVIISLFKTFKNRKITTIPLRKIKEKLEIDLLKKPKITTYITDETGPEFISRAE